MVTSAWFRPNSLELISDGVTTPWNQFDGGITGDELSDTPAGTDQAYFFHNDALTQVSTTLRVYDFGLSAIGLTAADRIDGIEIETETVTTNNARPISIRSIFVSKLGTKEDGSNEADQTQQSDRDNPTVLLHGAADNTWGSSPIAADLNATDFGFWVRTQAFGTLTQGRRSRILSFRVRIHYTPNGLLPELSITAVTATGAPLENARVYVEADAGGSIAAGTVLLNSLTDANGLATTNLAISGDQPVTGWARLSSSSPYYKEGLVVGTMDQFNGLVQSSVLVLDE